VTIPAQLQQRDPQVCLRMMSRCSDRSSLPCEAAGGQSPWTAPTFLRLRSRRPGRSGHRLLPPGLKQANTCALQASTAVQYRPGGTHAW